MLETLGNLIIYLTEDFFHYITTALVSVIYFSILSIFVNREESVSYKFGQVDYIFTIVCCIFWIIAIPISLLIMLLCLFHFIINKLSIFIRRKLDNDFWN